MDLATAALITSVITAVATLGAATTAAVAIRAQQNAERRHHNLDNLKWVLDKWEALKPHRVKAARMLLANQGFGMDLIEVLNFCETLGYLLRERYIDVQTIDQSIGWGVLQWHAAASPLIESQKRVSPGTASEFEWMSTRLKARTPISAERLTQFLEFETGIVHDTGVVHDPSHQEAGPSHTPNPAARR